MLSIQNINPSPKQSIALSIIFALDILPIFENKHPRENRPRQAIMAAFQYLLNPSEENKKAANAAYANVNATINYRAIRSVAYSAANAAAYAVANVATTANAGTKAIATDAAARYASSACFDNVINKENYIHSKLLSLFPYIVEMKIQEQWEYPFKFSEETWDSLNKESKENMLYHMDRV